MISLNIFRQKNIILLILLLFSLTLFSPINVIAEEPNPHTIPPNIIVKNITVNADGQTIINGVVSDNLTSAENIDMKLVYLDANQQQIDKEAITPNTNGTWSITRTFKENLNRYYIVAIDEPFSETEEPNKTIKPVPIPPTITVKDIRENADGKTTISGVVSDNLTSAENIEMKLVNYDSNQNENEIEMIIPDSKGAWSITRSFTEKLNRYYLVASDKSSIENEEPNKTTITVQRPYVTSIKITVLKYRHKIIENGVRNDKDETVEVDILNKSDMTRVVLNPTLTIEFSDGIPADISNPIYLYDKDGMVDSTIPTKSNNQLVLNFNNLNPRTTYYLMFNPSLISDEYKDKSALFLDDFGNMYFPMIKKFTTVSETVKDTAIDENMSEVPNQPHGFYSNNVNTCANCHSTHIAENKGLDKPLPDYKDKAKENSYCMACHDGTIAAPMPENLDPNNSKIISKHNAIENPEHSSSAGSCTSCHNPHLTWSEDNTNLLKDHYVYTKNDGSKIDSLEINCESCHEDNSVSANPDYHENAEREVLSYKKSSTADGQMGSYSLCLRCHNGVKASNIKQYYEDDNKVNESGHSIIAIDGSKLRGNIPCSECHDTHASTNLKLLKSKLGHENQTIFTLTNSEDWTDMRKREFCLSCHNGKNSVFEVTGNAIYDETTGEPLPIINKTTGEAIEPNTYIDHKKTSNKACSDCHGTGTTPEEKALSAAHAPTAGSQ